jgi:hypothetical protein
MLGSDKMPTGEGFYRKRHATGLRRRPSSIDTEHGS